VKRIPVHPVRRNSSVPKIPKLLLPIWGSYVGRGFSAPYVTKAGCCHNAADIKAAQGTPVLVPADGVVTAAVYSNSSSCGNQVDIEHAIRKGQPPILKTRYCHLSEIHVALGQRVKRGQQLGLSGGTPGTEGAGTSTGPHLHWEVRLGPGPDWKLVDPELYLTWQPRKWILPAIAVGAGVLALGTVVFLATRR
jgi:murein DD-endopeptidase MepM/ murein hydrolase activator NlpD